MVVDTSAIVAVLLDEPERDAFIDALLDADRILLSAAGYLEAVIVLTNRKLDAVSLLDAFVRRFCLTLVEVDEAQAKVAADAFLLFGKGRGTKAQLNFGDCLTYALAKTSGEALLFKGDDFVHTDLAFAV